ncbi:ABC-type sugar transport system, periplasmic component [Deinococcus saxicola]|uniref:extracellular solute-binding protein n=1 Tax=Deinococcus saxicola TaxID=249406 RepID=UPI0039EF4E88
MKRTLISLSLFALAAQASAVTTINYWDLLGGGDGERMQQLVDGFNKSQSDVKVQRTTLAWGVPYYTKLRTSAAVGQGPDLAILHLSRLSGWAEAKIVRPISTAELGSVGLSSKNFFPKLWDAASYKGQNYALPLDTHALVLYYNKDLLKKAGLLGADGAMKPLGSMAEFNAALNAVKTKTGALGVSFENGPNSYMPWRIWLALLAQQGGSIIKDNALTYGPLGASTLNTMTDWVKNGLATKNVDYPTSVAQFVNGKAAFMLNGVWEVPTLVDGRKSGKIGFDYGVMPMPKLYANQSTWADSHSFIIPNNVGKAASPEKINAALKFVAYAQKNALVWAGGGMIPANQGVTNSAAFKALKPNADFSATTAQNVTFDPLGWYSGAAGPLEAASAKYFPAAINGQLPVDKALGSFETEAKKLFNAAPKP